LKVYKLLPDEERLGRDGKAIRLTMTRSDIADYLGLTTETVSRTFTGFRAARLIELDGTTLVRVDGEEVRRFVAFVDQRFAGCELLRRDQRRQPVQRVCRGGAARRFAPSRAIATILRLGAERHEIGTGFVNGGGGQHRPSPALAGTSRAGKRTMG
jgi:hypothetical protein